MMISIIPVKKPGPPTRRYNRLF